MGLGDAILAKFDGTGGLRWATYYGGTGEDAWYSVATDSAGNVYASGQTESTSGIATPGAYQTSLSGAYDAFLVKFDSAGSRQWGTYYGGSANEYNYSVAVDNSANVYIAGLTAGSPGLATPAAYLATTAGANDGYLAKFSSSEAIVWATYLWRPRR